MRGDWDLESEYDNILYLTKADLIESNFSLLIYYDYKSKTAREKNHGQFADLHEVSLYLSGSQTGGILIKINMDRLF